MTGGLQARILRVVVGAAVLFSLIAGTLAYRLEYARTADNASETINDLLSAVEKTAAVAAYTRDALLLKEVIDGLERNKLVASVELRAPGGELLLPVKGRAVDADSQALEVTRTLISPFDAKETLAVLRVRADMPRLESAARTRAWTLALAMVGQTLLIAWVLYLAAANFVSRPIVRLASGLRAMSPGTFQRLESPGGHAGDEIGALVASANDLLSANESALLRERELRAEIEAMEAQYRQIFDSTSAGIFVLDHEGRLINGNPTVLKVVGADVDDMRQWRGQDFIERVFERPEKVRAMMSDALRRGETMSSDLELRQQAGGVRWVHCLISVQASPDAQQPMIEGVMYDVTERKRDEHDVRHQAEHDALTGLKNRRATEATLDRFLAEAQATEDDVVVMYLDLDGFKQVNDRLGHKAGDRVLVECAHRMLGAVRRSSDLVGRLGGDEFIVALHRTGPEDEVVETIAQALVCNLCEPIDLDDGITARVGASIGIASFPRHGTTRRGLLHAADKAMYSVKRRGKNGYAMAPNDDGSPPARPEVLAD
jgi:diguanylate cyclase (GGDEF)-like protein/PAS domain S-box-containing protein